MLFKSWKSAAAAGAAVLTMVAAPAQARDGYYRGHDRGGDDAAIAIGAGVVGLALGAALASRDRDRDNYYDDDYDYPRNYYYQSYPRYDSNNYDYPRYYRRGGNGWRHDRHDGWGHHGGHFRGGHRR